MTSQTPQIDTTTQMHTPNAGITLPFFQALITGVLTGLAAAGILVYFRVRDAWTLGAIAAAVITAMTWLRQLTNWQRRDWRELTMRLELLTGIDLDGGGVGASPEDTETRHTVTINVQEVSKSGGVTIETARFQGVTDQEMAAFAAGLLAGTPLSEGAWTGKDKLFTREKFREIRMVLINRNLAVLRNAKNEKQGYVLTKSGTAAMEELSHVPTHMRDV